VTTKIGPHEGWGAKRRVQRSNCYDSCSLYIGRACRY